MRKIIPAKQRNIFILNIGTLFPQARHAVQEGKDRRKFRFILHIDLLLMKTDSIIL